MTPQASIQAGAGHTKIWDTHFLKGSEEVLRRWTQVFAGPLLVQQYLLPQARARMGDGQLAMVAKLAATYRQRLADLSWFMRPAE